MLTDNYFEEKAKLLVNQFIADVPEVKKFQSEFEFAIYTTIKEVSYL